MSRSDRDQRDAERAARRARRLAERAAQRAGRKAEQARRAGERARKLADRAARRPSRDRDRGFEDYVDDVAERWSKKAEEWLDAQSRKFSEEDDLYRDDLDELDAATASLDAQAKQARRDAEMAKRAAEEAERSARRRRRSSSVRRRRRARRSLRSRLNSGRGLYRDKARGKICGVCAGVADYLDIAPWQVRLVAVLGLIFVPSVAVTVYFIAYFLMDDKPYYRRVTDAYEETDYDDYTEAAVNGNDEPGGRTSARQPRMSNGEALRTAKEKFADLEERLRSMESHVTSSRFELQRELRKISGDES